MPASLTTVLEKLDVLEKQHELLSGALTCQMEALSSSLGEVLSRWKSADLAFEPAANNASEPNQGWFHSEAIAVMGNPHENGNAVKLQMSKPCRAVVPLLPHEDETLNINLASPKSAVSQDMGGDLDTSASVCEGARSPTRSKLSRPRSSFGAEVLSEILPVASRCYAIDSKVSNDSFLGPLQRLARTITKESGCFEICFGAVIVFNAVLIGFETSRQVANGSASAVAGPLQHVCLALFVLELLLRFIAKGKTIFASWYVRLDIFLVGTCVAILWIIIPLAGSDTQAGLFHLITSFMLLRVMRLVKLVHTYRLAIGFKTMWPIIQGLLRSAETMISTGIVLIIVIYLFACVGLRLITTDKDFQNDPELRSILEEYFPNLGVTMLTLSQFIYADSISTIYIPLMRKKWHLCFYFIPLMIALSISLMNIVTAIMVNGAMTQSEQDRKDELREREHMLRALIPELRHIFRYADINGNGSLSLEEVEECAQALPPQIVEVVSPAGLADFFALIDSDNSGEITELEFVSGIVQSVLSESSFELQQVLKLQQAMSKQCESLAVLPNQIQEMLKRISAIEFLTAVNEI